MLTRMERTRLLIHCRWASRMIQPHWKDYNSLFTKLNIYLPFNPVIVLWGIYSREIKVILTCTYRHKQTKNKEKIVSKPRSFYLAHSKPNRWEAEVCSREDLFPMQPNEKGEQVSEPPPRGQGPWEVCGLKNKEAGHSEVWGAWGGWGKVIGKRRSHLLRYN